MVKKQKTRKKFGKKRPYPKKKPAKGFNRQFLLLIISIGVLYGFFSIPFYNSWLKGRIFQYYRQIPHQIETMDVEKRIIERHRYNYLIPKMINEQVSDSSIVLLPTRSYARDNFSKDFYNWHHPIWNYYFFGPGKYILFDPEKKQDYSRVSHAIICENQNIQLITIDSPDKLDFVVNNYLKQN